eukprot:1158590-Pelagomonas_calceolata.AAC.1
MLAWGGLALFWHHSILTTEKGSPEGPKRMDMEVGEFCFLVSGNGPSAPQRNLSLMHTAMFGRQDLFCPVLSGLQVSKGLRCGLTQIGVVLVFQQRIWFEMLPFRSVLTLHNDLHKDHGGNWTSRPHLCSSKHTTATPWGRRLRVVHVTDKPG